MAKYRYKYLMQLRMSTVLLKVFFARLQKPDLEEVMPGEPLTSMAFNSDKAANKPAVAPVSEDSTAEQQTHIDSGLIHYRSGRLNEAFVEFLQVLAVDPFDPLGHYLCGLTLQALKLEDMAVAEWAAASTLYVRDGAKWDSDWDWIKKKCYEFVEEHRDRSATG